MERTQVSAKIGRILLGEDEIIERIERLANQIKATYINSEKVTVIILLDGAKRFAENLLVLIDDDKFERFYVRASSYGDGLCSSGTVELEGLDDVPISGQDVLIIDDIYDSGLTMSSVVEIINSMKPRSVRTAVLLVKQAGRARQVNIDFKAAVVPDCFVVGYGLDYQGKYRSLPFIAALDIEDRG